MPNKQKDVEENEDKKFRYSITKCTESVSSTISKLPDVEIFPSSLHHDVEPKIKDLIKGINALVIGPIFRRFFFELLNFLNVPLYYKRLLYIENIDNTIVTRYLRLKFIFPIL